MLFFICLSVLVGLLSALGSWWVFSLLFFFFLFWARPIGRVCFSLVMFLFGFCILIL